MHTKFCSENLTEEPLGRLKCRCKDNIRLDFREAGCEDVDWIHLAQDRPVAGSYEHNNEQAGSIKSWEFPDQMSNY